MDGRMPVNETPAAVLAAPRASLSTGKDWNSTIVLKSSFK